MNQTQEASPILLLPDAGPLITLAYAQSLNVLLIPGWTVQIVDMLLYELTRNQTPTSHTIAQWVRDNDLCVVPTKTYHHFNVMQKTGSMPRKSNLGEFSVQEVMNEFALHNPPPTGIFLFEDHKIARSTFVLPQNCRKVSTRAFLLFLEQKQWIPSAADIERKAILNGRNFSQLQFPLGTM